MYLDEFDPVYVEHPSDPDDGWGNVVFRCSDIWKTGNLFSLYGDEQLLDGCDDIRDIKVL